MASRGVVRAIAAMAGAVAAAQTAAVVLRPRSGILAPVDVDVDAYFSRDDIVRARRFRRPQLALAAAGAVVDGAVLAALIRRPGGRRRSPALAAVGVSLALEAASLPLAAVARRRAIGVGLVTDSWRSWAADVAKSSAIGSGLAAAGGALAGTLMRRAGARWWLPASVVVSVAGTALMTAGPLVLDPLFNRFTPLPPGPLRDDVLELAERAGVRVGEVYEVDASRRTTAINAYVTGLGPTKRVVLYDTLIEGFSPDETRLVVAHELAHVRHRDVPRGLAFLALVAPPALLAVALLADELTGGDERAVVPALALAAGIISAPVGVCGRALSRAVERRADTYALELTGTPDAAIAFERRVAVRNLVDPDPPRWARVLLGTHPAIVERLGIAEAHRQAAAA